MGQMTIKDIAKKCGVGVSTVSRALNNHPDINPKTRELILKTVEEADFIPNNSARNLKRTDSKTIAIVVKEIDNPFFATMMTVMEREIRLMRYSFFIQHVGRNQNEVDAAAELVKENRLRGIIFLGGDFKKQGGRLMRLAVPIVVSAAELPRMDQKTVCSFVSIDDRTESRKMTEYLCEKGHRKIAILAACRQDDNVGKLRLAGYREALGEYGIPVREELIRHLDQEHSDYSMENGYRLMKRLLEERTEFTAVYAIADAMIIGACKAILESGKQIPADCEAAGFDGISETFYYEPSITTVKQPVEQIASESVSSLFEMIESKKSREGKILPARLVPRKSTGQEENQEVQI